MSSKVISSTEGQTALPMAWAKLSPTPPEPEPSRPVHQDAGNSHGDEKNGEYSHESALVEAAKLTECEEKIRQFQAQIAQQERLYAVDVAAAQQRGFAEGEANAKAGPVAEMQTATQRMIQSVRDLAQLRPRLRRDAESDVVRLAIAIARRVLRRETSVDPGAMQAIAQVALQKLGRQEVSRVYVHPNQAAAIRTTLESAGVRAEVVPETTREPGALVFETNQGLLDASVNAQLEEIERGLADRLNQL